ncbi:unnamed protein product [Gadus morhua 'NCC']
MNDNVMVVTVEVVEVVELVEVVVVVTVELVELVELVEVGGAGPDPIQHRPPVPASMVLQPPWGDVVSERFLHVSNPEISSCPGRRKYIRM